MEVADQTFYLTQSQYTDTGPTSPQCWFYNVTWQGSHWSANFWLDLEKSRRKMDLNPGSSAPEADALTSRPTRQLGWWSSLAVHCAETCKKYLGDRFAEPVVLAATLRLMFCRTVLLNQTHQATRCLSWPSNIRCLAGGPPRWLVVKASTSRAEDPDFKSRLRLDFSGVRVIPVTSKLALQWLPCQVPGVIGSVLGLVGLVSVYCDWVRWKVWSPTSISVWQHVQLSEQIRPWDTLACYWDVKQASKQPTNHPLEYHSGLAMGKQSLVSGSPLSRHMPYQSLKWSGKCSPCTYMFLKLVAKVFLQVLQSSPLLNWFNSSGNKIKLK